MYVFLCRNLNLHVRLTFYFLHSLSLSLSLSLPVPLSPLSLSFSSENEKNSTALMVAALEGDEIIVDILIACVRVLQLHTCVTLVWLRSTEETRVLSIDMVWNYCVHTDAWCNKVNEPSIKNDLKGGVDKLICINNLLLHATCMCYDIVQLTIFFGTTPVSLMCYFCVASGCRYECSRQGWSDGTVSGLQQASREDGHSTRQR